MNIDEILYECILANGNNSIRVTKALFDKWIEYAKDNPALCVHISNPSNQIDLRDVTIHNLFSRKVWQREQRQQILKDEQEIDRKRAQLGRERFQEFKSEGLNPTISAALACLAEQIGMEKIKEAMAQAEKQVKGKK